jgi:hypothetical protein
VRGTAPLIVLVGALAGVGAARATEPVAIPDEVEQARVTPDSARGWTPSGEQKQALAQALHDFLGEVDAGRAEEAYAFFTEQNRRLLTPQQFASEVSQFNTLAGPLRARRILRIEWTKDPASAPGPGIYAAIDLSARYANVDRSCGYLIFFQAPAGGAFQVMRRETTFMDNATAEQMEKGHSKQYVEAQWRGIARVCPNYQAQQSTQETLVESPPNEAKAAIAYASPTEALAALKAKPGVTVTVLPPQGWIIVEDRETLTLWSFTPSGHYAHPSVVKGTLQQVGDQQPIRIRMDVMCNADKASCDRLVREFQELNERMKASLQGSDEPPPQ